MVSIIDDIGGFTRLAPQWDELLEASTANCPFLTVEWLDSWWTRLGGSRRLHLLTVHHDDQLIAIAPLYLGRASMGMFSRLEFLGSGYAGSDYLDLIVRLGHEREALPALAGALGARKRALCLGHLPMGSLASRLADRLALDGWTSRTADAGVCPLIALAGHTWPSYLASLGAAHRANVRRRLRDLGQRFDMRFHQVTSEPERRQALSALVGFHDQRFGKRGSTFRTPALRAFHDDASRRMLERGWLRLYVLRLDGVVAAVMYGFAYNHRFYFYQHGFDARFGPFSAGLVLMALTIQAALEEGAREFDMLYGTEKYKSLWAREQRTLAQLQLFPPHLGGFLHRRTVEAGRSMRIAARRILSIGGARAT